MIHSSMFATTCLFGSLIVPLVKAQFPPFSLCTEGSCSDCPQSVTSGGNGYPSCVVYNSDDVFASGNFGASASGGYDVFFDIAQPNPGCTTLVKSPASVSAEQCGHTIGTFQNAACVELQLEDTFIVQFCCGADDCLAAGQGNAKRGERVEVNSAFGTVGVFGGSLSYTNGTTIVPKEQGPMPSAAKKRDTCVYTADGGMEEYTRSADNTQIVLNEVSDGRQGGVVVTIETARTQEWSTTMSAGVNIYEIVSASVDFEFSESITDSESYAFTIPPGQQGLVGFTANLRCTTGTIDQCGDDQSYHGETCTPYSITGEGIAGTYAVIAAS